MSTVAVAKHLVHRLPGNEFYLDLHPGQQRAMASERRFVLVLAGTQSGKTTFSPWWLWLEMERRGAGDYLAATATFDMYKLKLLPEMVNVFCTLLGWGVYRPSERVIESHDRTKRIILRSAQARGGLESATAKAAILDECGQPAFTVEAWEAIQRRLSLSQGRALGATTPYNLGWLKRDWYDRWAAGDEDYDVIQFASTANPAFPPEEMERARRTMPAWRFAMFYEGRFERPVGLIYEDFDTTSEIVEPFSIPAQWPTWVGVDFGAIHTALVWLAQDPQKDVYYVWRDELAGNKTTQEHARAALAIRPNVKGWWGGAPSEKQQRWDWGAAGAPVQQPPISDVEAGIDRVVSLFRTRRLKVFAQCAGILDELGSYSREIDPATGQATAAIRDKESYHRLDALRYGVSGMLGPAVSRGKVSAYA